MIDKRLFRDVSDLLELDVSDEKIVRILLVRGYTTEQIRRTIKDIRAKGDQPNEQPAKNGAVAETIETGPSRRFGFLNKIFGSRSDEEILAEETQKLVEQENEIKKEEAKIHEEVQRVVEKAKALERTTRVRTVTAVPDEVRDVLQMVDGLLEKLPEEEIRRFTQSPAFESYKAVMKKYAQSGTAH